MRSCVGQFGECFDADSSRLCAIPPVVVPRVTCPPHLWQPFLRVMRAAISTRAVRLARNGTKVLDPPPSLVQRLAQQNCVVRCVFSQCTAPAAEAEMCTLALLFRPSACVQCNWVEGPHRAGDRCSSATAESCPQDLDASQVIRKYCNHSNSFSRSAFPPIPTHAPPTHPR